MTNLKDLKCHSCETIIRVDRGTVSCQCSKCIMSGKPKVHAEEPDPAEQLELGEAAS